MQQLYSVADKDIITEALLGLKETSGNVHVDLGHKFVCKKNIDPSKVVLISGGGSGHEPAHVGYVGDGMLTGAVIGNVFASPSSKQITACIEYLLNVVKVKAGILLIVKNYTGDVTNFQLARDEIKAKRTPKEWKENPIEMVVIADDVADVDTKQKRGLAGALFVHKIVGAVAAQGKSIAFCLNLAALISRQISTLGIAFSVCHLPNQKEVRVMKGSEVGLGIHGERGASTIEDKLTTAEVARILVDEQVKKMNLTSKDTVVVLVNNLGGLTDLEAYSLTHYVATLIRDTHQITLARIYCSRFMTSLDMRGASVSFLKNPAYEYLFGLDYEVDVAAWPVRKCVAIDPRDAGGKSVPRNPSNNNDVQETVKKMKIIGERFGKSIDVGVLRGGIKHLMDKKDYLNELDLKCGDGDTGTTISLTCEAFLALLSEIVKPNEVEVNLGIVLGCAKEAFGESGGSFGGLLSHFFVESINEKDISFGWEKLKQVGAKPKARTMMDVLYSVMPLVLEGNFDLSTLATVAEKASEETKTMKATFGRAAQVPFESYEGTPDPGAEAFALFFKGLAGNF